MSYVSLLIHTVDLITRTFDKLGDPAETTETGVKCRVMYTIQKIKSFKGEEVTSYAKLFFKVGQTITPETMVVIDGVEYPVVKISRPSDSNQIHHKEVWIS